MSSSSLIKTVREKFLDVFRSVQSQERWRDLVVDAFSKKLLFAVLEKKEVLGYKITGVEEISDYRAPQPNQEAIYILMPTTQNVDRVIAEFSNGRRQHARVFLYFIESLSQDLFDRLSSSPALDYLGCATELFVNFQVLEHQVFSMQEPELFFSMFSPPRSQQEFKPAQDRLLEDIRFASKIIANVCITLDEFPYIRYYNPQHHPPLGPLAPNAQTLPPPPRQEEGSARWRTNMARGQQSREYEAAENEFLAKKLARMVQENLEEYQKANKDFPKATPGRSRGTLIITDRSMDTIAPFVHEFTYQAMAQDLLKIEDGRTYMYKYQNEKGIVEDTAVTLSDEDTVWTSVRHMHMREAIDKLMADFNEFMQKHAGFKGNEAVSLDTMKDMLASLPEYQEQRAKFSVHLNMAQECMDIFERRNLPAIATIEQNCATGLTAEGRTPKTLVEEMVPLLDSREVINKDKVRIIALYIQHREGVPDEDRRRLYQHARLSMAEQDAINGLVHLGVRISRGPGDRDLKKKLKSKSSNNEDYDLSRYKPVLDTVLDEEVSNRLDHSIFPYIGDTPAKTSSLASLRQQPAAPAAPAKTSLRSAKPTWHRPAASVVAREQVRQRLIVFVAGGMTYSEMRTVYQKSTSLNRDIYIGSTHVVTPEGFIDDLKVLDLGGTGSKALYNGVRSRGMASPSFQAFYDQKYFVQDPAPPPRTASAPATDNSRLVPNKLTSARSFQSTTSDIGGLSNSSEFSLREFEKKKEKKSRFFRF